MTSALPLTVFAFSAPAVNYVSTVFNSTTRWPVLAFLFVTIAPRRIIFSIAQSAAGAAALTYGLWCISTALWSAVPMLSALKASALLLLMIAMFAAGQGWLRLVALRDAINYALPMSALALFAGIAGQASMAAQVELGTGLIAYQGLTTNPNMFGSIMTMGLPVLLWGAYRGWRAGRPLSLWSLLLAAVLIFLFLSRSRASMLASMGTICGFVFALRSQHRFLVIASTLAATGLAYIAMPDIGNYAEVYIKKGGSSVMFSREQVWSKSLENAREGGLLGLGYGVTAGEQNFELSMTSVGYGREKGNSQMAIVEETGLVGFGLYILFIAASFKSIFRALRLSTDADTRIMIGILGGAWFGMLINSLFEAWWVAPGSPEAVWFWSLTGVLMACTNALRTEPRAMMEHVPLSSHSPVGS